MYKRWTINDLIYTRVEYIRSDPFNVRHYLFQKRPTFFESITFYSMTSCHQTTFLLFLVVIIFIFKNYNHLRATFKGLSGRYISLDMSISTVRVWRQFGVDLTIIILFISRPHNVRAYHCCCRYACFCELGRTKKRDEKTRPHL